MKYNVNLLRKKEQSISDKIVYFSLHYLRYIIVITQLVVIIVFFYRFRIDQSIIDLKESVDQKKEIIQVALPLIKKAEIIDKKKKEIVTILSSQDRSLNMVAYVLSIFPESLTLEKMEVDNDSIIFNGIAKDPKDLQNFYLILKEEKKFAVVELGTIKKNENGFLFSLKMYNFSDKEKNGKG